MDFNERLRKDSKLWVEQNLLSQEQRDGILSLYPPNKENLAPQVLGVFAALLVGTGVISLLAWNWDFFDRSLRLILAFAPLVLTQILLFRAWGQDRPVFRETSVVLNGLAIVSTLALSSQIYQIQGSAFFLLLISAGLMIPTSIMFRSLAGGALLGFLLFLSAFFESWNEAGAAIGLVLMSALALISWRRSRRGQTSETLIWVMAVALPFMVSFYGGDHLRGGLVLVQLSLLGSGLALAAPRAGRPFRVAALVLQLIVLGTLGFQFFWQEILLDQVAHVFRTAKVLPLAWMAALVLAFVVQLVLIIRKLIARKHPEPLELAGPVLSVLWLTGTFLGAAGIPALYPALLANLLGLAWGLNLVLKRLGTPREVIGGALILVGILNQRFFDSEFSLLVKGSIFILSGAGLYVLWRLRFGPGTRKGSEEAS